jgi:hypothetical protein
MLLRLKVLLQCNSLPIATLNFFGYAKQSPASASLDQAGKRRRRETDPLHTSARQAARRLCEGALGWLVVSLLYSKKYSTRLSCDILTSS